MAGSNSAFDPDLFRQKITDTMIMGLPPNVQDRATFRWKTEKTFTRPDPKGIPYNLNQAAITTDEHEDVQIPVAVAIPTRATINKVYTPAGEINDDVRIVITVLDTHFPLVEGADYVLLGGNTYKIDYWGPPLGLFSVEIYQAFCSAEDEA